MQAFFNLHGFLTRAPDGSSSCRSGPADARAQRTLVAATRAKSPCSVSTSRASWSASAELAVTVAASPSTRAGRYRGPRWRECFRRSRRHIRRGPRWSARWRPATARDGHHRSRSRLRSAHRARSGCRCCQKAKTRSVEGWREARSGTGVRVPEPYVVGVSQDWLTGAHEVAGHHFVVAGLLLGVDLVAPNREGRDGRAERSPPELDRGVWRPSRSRWARPR